MMLPAGSTSSPRSTSSSSPACSPTSTAAPSHPGRRGGESIVDPDILKSVVATTMSVENEVLVREEVAAVVDCLKTFPQREQDIVSLKFDAELTNGQIAQVMGLTEANVRVILFRPLRKLRGMVKSSTPAE